MKIVCKLFGIILLIHVMGYLEAKPTDYRDDLVKQAKCDILTWKFDHYGVWSVEKLNKKSDNDSSNGLKVWWLPLGRCVDLTTEADTDLCPNGTPLINSLKEGTCNCDWTSAEIQGKEGCYEYFQQGPCASGEVVTHDTLLKKDVCSKDLCAIQNTNVTLNSECRYVPLNGNGSCYMLGSAGPCDANEIVLVSYEKVPSCQMIPTYFLRFPEPPCLISEKTFSCRIQVSVTSEDDKTKYIDQLKADLQ